jgi:hypothetical protein
MRPAFHLLYLINVVNLFARLETNLNFYVKYAILKLNKISWENQVT